MHYRSFLEVRRNPFAGALFERIFEIFRWSGHRPRLVRRKSSPHADQLFLCSPFSSFPQRPDTKLSSADALGAGVSRVSA
uniref:Uncharacterized protein n=1 Tax=Chelativorans sp. (strain BNC1) TaxID=266779 RepID=Q11AI0_CHESB